MNDYNREFCKKSEGEIKKALKEGKEWIALPLGCNEMIYLSDTFRHLEIKFPCYKEEGNGSRVTLVTWVMKADVPRVKTEFWGIEGDLDMALRF